MSLGRELLPTGFQVGVFFPQEFRRVSSSHRSSDRIVLATGVQAGKLSQQEISQGSSCRQCFGADLDPDPDPRFRTSD
jgi:hypothetical protein